MSLRVIGCGNLHRGDDAAGVLVARRLRELGVPADEREGEMLQLLDTWKPEDTVLLVDAMAAAGTPGKIRTWSVHDTPFVAESLRCSTHAFGVREAVELAKALGRMPQKLIVYGIEGRQFQAGTSPSAEVAEAVETVARQIFEHAR